MRNLTAFVIYQNDSVLPEEGYMLGELLSNRIKSFTLAGVSSDYSEILITSECPGVEVTTAC
ncbi:TPA: hypothetical protein EYP27_05315 [Candidatus Bathyarchaeota archaeon]|nr:hypothetical protein [Candidatus Bathyarchaeota archaeon]